MPARRTEIDDREIIERYEAGETLEEIASTVNLSVSGVQYRLKTAGIERRSAGAPSKFDELEICRMYRDRSVAVKMIREEFQISRSAMYLILEKHGVPVRLERRKWERPEIQSEVRNLFSEGKNRDEISDIVGLSRNYIAKILNQKVEEITVERKRWQSTVTVTNQMSVREMRDRDLTIDEIADITGMSRVDVFQELQS